MEAISPWVDHRREFIAGVNPRAEREPRNPADGGGGTLVLSTAPIFGGKQNLLRPRKNYFPCGVPSVKRVVDPGFPVLLCSNPLGLRGVLGALFLFSPSPDPRASLAPRLRQDLRMAARLLQAEGGGRRPGRPRPAAAPQRPVLHRPHAHAVQ